MIQHSQLSIAYCLSLMLYKSTHILIFIVHNYNIGWCKDCYSADYKFFHKYNSTKSRSMIENNAPFRYPFADIFIFSHDKKYDIWTYRNIWRTRLPGIGFNTTYKWPNATKLTNFGNFQMRVSVENRKFLEKEVGKNWYEVGVTPLDDHYNNFRKDEIAFELTPRLYSPALPFY